MSLNSSQLRIIDPILSDHARGYTNADFIGHVLFPRVFIPFNGMKRIKFGLESFMRKRTRRAPGTPINVLEFGYEAEPISLHQEALSALVPIEHQREAQVPGVDLQARGVNTTLAVIALEKEIQQAEAARNAAKYAATNKIALAGDDKWSDPDSDPKTVVYDYKEVVRRQIGRRPNTLVLGGAVVSALGKHPRIRDHFKYTNSAAISLPMLASYFDIENVVSGDGIYASDAGVRADIWGNDAIMAWVPRGESSYELPSYGYTYQLESHPVVEAVRWDAERRSHKNDVIDEFSADVIGADAGVLFQSTL